MICFWISGTSSKGSSTPRSPRATMMASEASRMPHRFLSAVSFSIFATSLTPARHQLPQLLDIFRPPDEGKRDVVHSQRRRLADVFHVLLGERGRAHLDPRQVHPLVCLELTAVMHHSLDPVPLDRPDFERQQAVVQQDPRADADVPCEIVVGGGNLSRLRRLLRREGDPLARLQPERLLQGADPDPGPLQVEQNRRRLPPTLQHGAELMNPTRPDLRRTVGCIDSNDVDARVEQGGHLRRLFPGRAQCGDDLGSANRCARHGGSLMQHGHTRMTASPATTVSTAWPRRKASPSPSSAAGSTSQATRSASKPGASRPRRAPVPAAWDGATVYA